MKLKANNNSGGGFDIPPAGAHQAVLVAIIDLGTHDNEFKDKKTGATKVYAQRKVLLAWELTDCEVSGKKGVNHVVAAEYTASLSNKASLRKLIEGWRGKTLADGEEFDLFKMLGAYCQITIAHGQSAKGNAYAKISGVTPLMSGIAKKPPLYKPFSWEFGQGDYPDPDWVPYVFGSKPADIINSSKEARGEVIPVGAGVGNDELPF